MTVTILVTTKSIILLFTVINIVFISLIISSTVSVYGESYYQLSYLDQVNENYSNYNESLWSIGNNLQEGDLYEYKICSDKTILKVIHPYHCYTISLEFVTILESYTGKVWVVQGNFTTLGSTPELSQQMIFLIDPVTFKVTTDKLNVDLGNSIYNTIFSLSQYGKKSLSIGTIWDQLDSYFTNKIPLEIKNKQTIQILNGSNYDTIEASVLSYDIIVPSNTYLHPDFPFPVKASIFSPNIIFPKPIEEYWYELESYSYNNRNVIFNEHENIVTVPTFEVRLN